MTLQEAYNQALQHHRAGQLAEAEALYRKILAQSPNHPETMHLLGVVAQQVGKHDAALELIGRAISASPNQAEFYGSLGVSLVAVNRIGDSIKVYRKAISIRPDLAAAHNNLGNSLAAIGEHDQAIESFQTAMKLQPSFSDAPYNLANLYKTRGRLAEAVELYRRALALRPNWPQALNNLGLTLRDMGNQNEAMGCFAQALNAAPAYAEALTNLADALCDTRQFQQAIALGQRAVAGDPNMPEAHNNLGNALCGVNRFDEAIVAFRNAVALRPYYAEAHNNLGNAYYGKGEIDQAIALHRTALALRNDYPSAHWNLAVMLGIKGQWEQAWPEFEQGWSSQKFAQTRNYRQQLWDGGDLNGRRILLHSEQGLGDAIQFARYISLLKAQHAGAKISLVCQRPLHGLFKSISGIDQLIDLDEPLPEHDVHYPLMLLAKMFPTTVDQLPAKTPYLAADPEISAKWRAKLNGEKRRKIGLVWAGLEYPDPYRSMTLDQMARLARAGDLALISLQTGNAAMQAIVPPEGMNVSAWTDELTDFAQTAALIDSLDLVITVDTAAAHLAGAMGKPTWLLLKSVPDWRWMLDRCDSPWYPTMRLFRQTKAGDWETPIAEVAEELRKKSW